MKTAVAFANAFHRQTDPIIYPTIRTVQIKNKTVIAVRVPPVRTNLIPLNGQAYRRVGRTTQTLNRSEYERLLFERHANGYETLQATGARWEDLDEAALEAYYLRLAGSKFVRTIYE